MFFQEGLCCLLTGWAMPPQDLVESVSVMNDKNNDWFLVAPDFTDYLRAQVQPLQRLS